MPQTMRPVRLHSVKVVGRIGYVNSDPAMPFMFPVGAWRVNELAEHIARACVEYDIEVKWDNAKTLALSIAKKILRDTLEGGFDNLD